MAYKHDLFNAVLKKLDNPEFEVSLIVLNDKINNKQEGVDFQRLIQLGGHFYYSSVENMVHHKFCIIDDKTVITGSYNWTYYAENRNWENVVVINEAEVVEGYSEEFKRLIESHQEVLIVAEMRKLDLSQNSIAYLQTDYMLQAKNEEQRGNDLAATKVYNQLLRLNSEQPAIQKARALALQKLNGQTFNCCPFEIGILFRNGYSTVIPAFLALPTTVMTCTGTTPTSNANGLSITVQKYDYHRQTIFVGSLNSIKPAPVNTPKLEIGLQIDQHSILHVYLDELNGHNRSKSFKVDLKGFL